MDKGRDMDITKNIKIVEWLKSELLTGIASLYQLLLKGARGSQEAALDILANIILVAYLLARRLGMSYSAVDIKVENKIKLAIAEDHEIEKWSGDLSSLSTYLNRSRNQG